MSKHFFLVLCLAAFTVALHAETVTLKTGKVVEGTILIQNDEVIILKDYNGQRYQFMMSDVQSVSQPSTEQAEATPEEQSTKAAGTTSTKKTAFLLELAGGGSTVPTFNTGGFGSADILIGSRQLLQRAIFLGGGIGWHGDFIPNPSDTAAQIDAYHFLPIQFAARIPLMSGVHSPFVGIGLGYGIAMSKDYKGGVYASIDAGYRYQINHTAALFVGFQAQFQQATINVVETFDESSYTNPTGRSFVRYGLKLGLLF